MTHVWSLGINAKKKNSSDVSATIPKVERHSLQVFFFLTKTHTEKEK